MKIEPVPTIRCGHEKGAVICQGSVYNDETQGTPLKKLPERHTCKVGTVIDLGCCKWVRVNASHAAKLPWRRVPRDWEVF